MNRRAFLKYSLAGSGVAAGTQSMTSYSAAASVNENILLYVFLRGGADGLHILPPIDGIDRGYYETLRPQLKIPASGAGAALSLAHQQGTEFGLNNVAAALKELFDDGHLAIVQGVGMPDSSRSHFDAMAYTELATPGIVTTSSGWLARHFATTSNLPTDIPLPVLAVGTTPPTSLLGSRTVLTMNDPDEFGVGYGHWRWDNANEGAAVDRDSTLRLLYGGNDFVSVAGQQALIADQIISAIDFDQGSNYPNDYFSQQLKVVAQLIKADVGLRVATVDFGGWDTHAGQNGGMFEQELLTPLAAGLSAVFNDLQGAGYGQRLVIVVQSEFGRRVYDNADGGTDHGTANLMLVISGAVKGGRLFGQWPGLHQDQLFEQDDLAVTTDFRQVLGEVVQEHLGNSDLAAVFPGFNQYSPLGLFANNNAGQDNEIVSDNFDLNN